MTEAEVLFQFAYNWEIMYALLQWWLGVSVGLLAVSRFFSGKLNLFLVVLLALLYVSFSTYSWFQIGIFFEQNLGFTADLRVMQTEGALSAAAVNLLAQFDGAGPPIRWSYAICVFGGFFGTVAYFLYSYFKSRSQG